ncbi:uncharacterized protein LOC105210504 [Zeugodacus cucurbitae]|uniref:Coiled-coil and C2 domain-containing protein 1-like n=1 Tax=Zeugodacus cucurbitae TaxID=28588 RepID=A0A0A1WJX1_ZEUCU|nr:uncharacterized protein LOC105210504 [Zeugodacus cucurbitae]
MALCGLKKLLFFSLQVAICIYLSIDSTTAVCNVCQDNQVACINSTSFYLCFGDNNPNMDVLYHCKEGFECTEFNAICLQASATRAPSCGSTSLCRQCTAQRNALFACLSRTTFQMCYGALHPTGQVGICPSGFVCDATSDAICVSAAGPHTVTCDVIDPSTEPTTASPPTSLPTTPTYPLTPNEVCAQQTRTGLYPTMPHDPYCKRYIHCRNKRGTEYSCAPNTYFSMENKACTINKPAYCI